MPKLRVAGLCLLVLACSCRNPTPSAELVRELAARQDETGLTIGRFDGVKVEAIVFKSTPEMQDLELSSAEARAALAESDRANNVMVPGSDAELSPDQKWITYRTRDNKFVLAASDGDVKRELLDGSDVLTSLQWSPDSDFLMYVRGTGAWDGGECAKYVSDGRNIMVYRVKDGKQSFIYQVCDGYPYQAFRWMIASSTKGRRH